MGLPELPVMLEATLDIHDELSFAYIKRLFELLGVIKHLFGTLCAREKREWR